jgi:Leu/Phe-tRNA-protein transferase
MIGHQPFQVPFPLDEFVIELRKLTKNCQFANTDNEILTQVIQNCKSNRLRRRALKEPDRTLDDLLTMGRALKSSRLSLDRHTLLK